ncbi:MAG: hypothetical protein K2K84_05435, partial [Muribaculaceae bacterium]|nr:hypothetical protein [Muribaculaceae bacterium]
SCSPFFVYLNPLSKQHWVATCRDRDNALSLKCFLAVAACRDPTFGPEPNAAKRARRAHGSG